MKIFVGTANWGQEYGISHVKVPREEIDRILTVADAHGCGIETAYDYNCMDALRGLGDQFTVIFKGDDEAHFHEAKETIGRIIKMKHHPPYDKWDHRSVYNLEDHSWDMCEFPYNIVDQRFGKRIEEYGYNIARSVFIQGLAFQMPDFHGIPFYHLCWNFVRNNPNIDGIVVGVDSAAQLEDILNIPQYEIDYSKIGQDGWIKKY